ncbi:MAG: 3-hydroxyacyl-ACP dehydratase [Aquaticitalea sp.]
MLLDDFYKVKDLKSLDDHSFEMIVKLHENHKIFKGHFPNFPVTPGVAMLQIIKNGLENHLDESLQIQSSSQIKFLNLVNPSEQSILIFNIGYTIENELFKVKNTTTFEDGSSVLKCNVTFVKK